MPPRVVVVTGSTATGKTAVGAALAKEISGEVISADSMQLYQMMNIGTAKPSTEEMLGVPHHMLGTASPFEGYSVSRYVRDAARCVDDVLARGKLPLIVGGTGLYIESLLSDRDFAPRDDSGAREKYSALYEEKGGEEMLRLLGEKDPERARRLHPNDKKRIIRALEAAEQGEPLSRHDALTRTAPPRYDAAVIVLNFSDRAELYRRIDRRVDDMMKRGLLEEVKALLRAGLTPAHTAMQAIGYKELCAALGGECTVEEAVEVIKRKSRRYAKRQISWCRRYENALRIDWDTAPDLAEGLRLSTKFLRGSGVR